jgi:hypothetical protein
MPDSRLPEELYDLTLEEVSLVDKGDCPEAHITFYKRDSYACPGCDSSFDSEESLRGHMNSTGHSDEDGDEPTEKAAPMKTENGQSFPKSAYAYTPSDQPSDWKLRLWESPEAKETPAQVGRAIAALGKGFRGNKVEIPSDDLPAVKRKVAAAYKRVNPNKEVPDVLKRDEVGTVRRLASAVAKLLRVEKDTLVFIDDDDDLAEDMRDLMNGTDSEEEESPEEESAEAMPAAPILCPSMTLGELADLLSGIGKAASGGDEEGSDEEQGGEDTSGKKPQDQEDESDEESEMDKMDKDQRIAELEAEVKKLRGEEEPKDEILKGASPEVIQKIADLEKRLADKEATERREEMISKVRGECASVATEVEKVADALLEVESAETRELLLKTLSAANEAVVQGAFFDEFGKSGVVTPSSAAEELDVVAGEIRKNSPVLTYEQAFTKAVEQRPDLRAQYNREMKAAQR